MLSLDYVGSRRKRWLVLKSGCTTINVESRAFRIAGLPECLYFDYFFNAGVWAE